MAVNRIVISFLFSLVIPLTGCWYGDIPRVESYQYLSKHSDMSEQEIRAFAYDGEIELERLIQMTESKSHQVRRLAAKNPKLPMEYLEKMMGDKSWKVIVASSHNPNFTSEMFDKLTIHRNIKIRQYLSWYNKRIPVKNLVALSKDKVNEVRTSAARHPGLPEEDIRRLAKDEFRGARDAVASNKNVPVDVLVDLSKGDSFLQAAENAKLPEEDIRRIFAMKVKGVSRRCLNRSLVRNPSTPIDILLEINKDSNGNIRKDIMKHPQMKSYRKRTR